ncbi:MAG: DNA topoisomerase IV [Bacteroidota bacterium]
MDTTNLWLKLAVVLLLLSSCQTPPERNCTAFKVGTYSFTTIVEGDTLSTTFVRQEDQEIEYFKETTDTAFIRWINKCEYILKKKNPKNKAEEKSIHVKILNTFENAYNFEYGVVGEPNRLKGTAHKIEK